MSVFGDISEYVVAHNLNSIKKLVEEKGKLPKIVEYINVAYYLHFFADLFSRYPMTLNLPYGNKSLAQIFHEIIFTIYSDSYNNELKIRRIRFPDYMKEFESKNSFTLDTNEVFSDVISEFGHVNVIRIFTLIYMTGFYNNFN